MIEVRWRVLRRNDPAWYYCRCLYAYLDRNCKEILYLGKAWSFSVKDRWFAIDKENFWVDLERERGITNHVVVIGELYLTASQKLTYQLLSDIESLLIYEEQPWGNIQSKKSRISRFGMTMKCTGNWPGMGSYIDHSANYY